MLYRVVSASAAVLAGLEFHSRPDLTNTLIGTVAFMPGARSKESYA